MSDYYDIFFKGLGLPEYPDGKYDFKDKKTKEELVKQLIFLYKDLYKIQEKKVYNVETKYYEGENGMFETDIWNNGTNKIRFDILLGEDLWKGEIFFHFWGQKDCHDLEADYEFDPPTIKTHYQN